MTAGPPPAAAPAGSAAPPGALPYEIVDVFTETAFAGNPLAVVLDADGLSTAQLQVLAREFNLSETAFPLPPTDAERAAGASYHLRIFTPAVELPFAGHPSLGAAAVLARLGRFGVGAGELVQACGAGLLPLQVDGGAADPVAPVRVELTGAEPSLSAEQPAEPLLAAVSLDASDLAGPAPRCAGTGIEFAYLLVNDNAVRRATPDLAALRRVMNALRVTGLAVASWELAGESAVAHLRMFGSEIGVAEDPATGSAALGLGVYLVAAGMLPGEGLSSFVVRQGAEVGRPSSLYVAVLAQDAAAVRCRVAGSVVPVASGSIRSP